MCSSDLFPGSGLRGTSCLQIAVCSGNLPLVQRLVDTGGDLDSRNSSGDTPLGIAARMGRLPLMQVLIDSGACTSDCAIEGRSLLHVAVDSGNPEVIEYVARVVGDRNRVSTDIGSTAAHVAARVGTMHTIRTVFELADIEVDIIDQYNRTPLFEAIERGDVEVVDYPLRKGAAVIPPPERKYGRLTPLLVACRSSLAIMERLVQSLQTSTPAIVFGGLPEVKSGEFLMKAIENGRVEVAKYQIGRAHV